MNDCVKIGLMSISDRASGGIYPDKGIPELENWLKRAVCNPCHFVTYLVPDDQHTIEKKLLFLVDEIQCDLIFTTGGTGPAARDVTPEATLAIADRVMPGFGEQMRQIGLCFVPTALLSRQVAVIRKNTLILNLPGQPKAIREILEGVKHGPGGSPVCGIFSSIPYCIQLLGGPYIDTHEDVIKAFRPNTAIKTPS